MEIEEDSVEEEEDSVEADKVDMMMVVPERVTLVHFLETELSSKCECADI